jgi:hypothetical protein
MRCPPPCAYPWTLGLIPPHPCIPGHGVPPPHRVAPGAWEGVGLSPHGDPCVPPIAPRRQAGQCVCRPWPPLLPAPPPFYSDTGLVCAALPPSHIHPWPGWGRFWCTYHPTAWGARLENAITFDPVLLGGCCLYVRTPFISGHVAHQFSPLFLSWITTCHSGCTPLHFTLGCLLDPWTT